MTERASPVERVAAAIGQELPPALPLDQGPASSLASALAEANATEVSAPPTSVDDRGGADGAARSGEPVVRVYVLALALAAAVDFAVRAVATSYFDVPSDTNALRLTPLLLANVLPVGTTVLGIYALLIRPHSRAARRYGAALVLALPIVVYALNVALLDRRGARELATSGLLLALPILVATVAMLPLRGRPFASVQAGTEREHPELAAAILAIDAALAATNDARTEAIAAAEAANDRLAALAATKRALAAALEATERANETFADLAATNDVLAAVLTEAETAGEKADEEARVAAARVAALRVDFTQIPAPATRPPAARKTPRAGKFAQFLALLALAVGGGFAIWLATDDGAATRPASRDATLHAGRPAAAPRDKLVVKAAATTAAAPAVRRQSADVRLRGLDRDSWLEVRRGSSTGAVLFTGMLGSGRSLHFTGPRIWIRFGGASNVAVTFNHRRVLLSGTVEKLFTTGRLR